MTQRLLAAALLVLAACSKPDATRADSAAAAPSAAPADRVAMAAAVSDAIAADPAKADSILRANNLTQEQFQQMMFDIAADSSQSARYAAAKKR
jgi:hypothetical protein